MLLLCALIVGTSAWADSYTITFGNNASGNTALTSTVNASTVISDGTSYVTDKPFTISGGTDAKAYYGDNQQSIRLCKQNKAATLTIALSDAGKKKATSIVVNCWKFSDSYKGTLAVNGMTAQNVPAGGSAGNLTFTFASATDIENIVLSGTKATFIYSITVNYSAGSASDPSISASNVNIAYTATDGSITYSVSNPAGDGVMTAARTAGDWLTVGEVGASSVAFTCSANTGSQRTATVRLTYTYNTSETVTKDVKVTQAPAPQNYTLASSLTSGKIYVIASGTSGDVKVMGEQKDTNRGTVDGSITGTTLTTTSAAEVVAYGPDASGYYTLYTADGYLYAASSDKNQMKSQSTNDMNGKWSISIDGETKEAEVVAHGTNTRNIIHYNPNNGSPVYSCYGSTSSIDNPVYLFEKADAAVATTTSVKLNGSGYATFATTTALDFQDADDATFSAWQITAANSSTGVITFSQIKGHVAAGKGILLKGTAGDAIDLNILPVGGDALSSNKLVGITEATAVADDTYYGLKGNVFKMVGAGTIPAGKALLPASEVSSARELTFVFEDETTGIKSIDNGQLIMDNGAVYDLQGRKVTKPVKGGLYIVNGKKVIK